MPTMFPFQEDSLVLQPAKMPLVPPLVVMLATAAGGLWLIGHGSPVGWLALSLGAAGSALITAHLVLNRTYIWLTVEGMTLGSFFGVRHLTWSEIEWCDATRRGVEIRCKVGPRVRKVAVLSEAYRMQPKEMAQLLNQWRIRAARGAHIT